MANKTESEIEIDIQTRVSAHRFSHILSVQETALKIFDSIQDSLRAEDFRQIINTESFKSKLRLASVLHDSCKELKNEEQIQLAKFYGIHIFDEDKDCPNLLHARVGAKWAEEEYEILDPYILKAIEEHTLGGDNMLLSSKILFLADLIEPLRKSYPELEKIRMMIYEEKKLDGSLLLAMNNKISYVIAKQQKIHPLAIQARNCLLDSL